MKRGISDQKIRIPASLPITNWWPSAACAKAFWSQQDCSPYQRLLEDTLEWAAPEAHENWLDLGCGGGAITRAIWEQTNGTVGSIVGLDCAAANEAAYRRLSKTVIPAPADRIQFIHHNFSSGLGLFPDRIFDHVVSGLSISYAEFYDDVTGQWTTAAYDRLLAEVHRVIRPGGRFVFSVNVPEPSWARVAWRSLPGLFGTGHVLRTLKRSWRMLRYGRWLKREARVGPIPLSPSRRAESQVVECRVYIDHSPPELLRSSVYLPRHQTQLAGAP